MNWNIFTFRYLRTIETVFRMMFLVSFISLSSVLILSLFAVVTVRKFMDIIWNACIIFNIFLARVVSGNCVHFVCQLSALFRMLSRNMSGNKGNKLYAFVSPCLDESIYFRTRNYNVQFTTFRGINCQWRIKNFSVFYCNQLKSQLNWR